MSRRKEFIHFVSIGSIQNADSYKINVKFEAEHIEFKFPGSFLLGTFIGISVKGETIEFDKRIIVRQKDD